MPGSTVTIVEPGAAGPANHFSCSFEKNPSSFMHSTTRSIFSRVAASSSRKGVENTRPVLTAIEVLSYGFCFAAHPDALPLAMLAKARPESTAWIASAFLP